MVFLHGFLENHTMWKSIKKHFVHSHQIILIDLPCHGKSFYEGNHCSMTFMAECVHNVLQKENVSQPYVFGHSMGGYVGLELLKLMPIKLTLVHSNFWADDDQKKQDRNRVIELVKTKKHFFIQQAIPNLFYTKNIIKCQDIIHQLKQKAYQTPALQIIAATKGMRDRADHTKVLQKHNVSIIQGQFDPVIPEQTMLKQLSTINKKQPYYTINNVGHMSIWEAPESLIKIIENILKH
jgi:pimeloyl-ACP methyl ester carboxylesterase